MLPNATETRIVVTGNYRAWRHFVAMRASEHADVEIRELAIACLRELQRVAGNVFGDFRISPCPTAPRSPRARSSPRAEPPRAGAPGAAGRRPRRSLGTVAAPIDTQYEDLLRRILEQGTPKQDRTGTGTVSLFGERLRYDLSETLPAGDDEEGALPVDRRRAAVVPPRRQQRRLAARPRRHHLGRVGLARRGSSARSTASSGGRGRRPDGAADRPDPDDPGRRCAPTPTPGA